MLFVIFLWPVNRFGLVKFSHAMRLSGEGSKTLVWVLFWDGSHDVVADFNNFSLREEEHTVMSPHITGAFLLCENPVGPSS